MIKTSILYSTIEEVRNKVIFKFIGKDEYELILSRKVFYDEIKTRANTQLPPETCLHKFMRVVLEGGPPPYHTEYRNINENQNVNQTFDNVLLQIRTRYGYSRRHTSCVRSRSKLLSSSYSKSLLPGELRRNSNVSATNMNNNANSSTTNLNTTEGNFDEGINKINKDIQMQRKMSTASQLEFKMPMTGLSRSMKRKSVNHPLSARSYVVIKQNNVL